MLGVGEGKEGGHSTQSASVLQLACMHDFRNPRVQPACQLAQRVKLTRRMQPAITWDV